MKRFPTSWRLSPYCCARLACAGAMLLFATLAAATDRVGVESRSLKSAAGTACGRDTKSCRSPAAVGTPATAPGMEVPAGDRPAATPTVHLHLTRPRAAVMDPRDLPDFQFENDSGFAERLKDLRSLPVITLWQSPRTQIYLGVDQRGLAGLHCRQRRNSGDQNSLWHAWADSGRHSATNDSQPTLRAVSP
jgi:hypothetical protein